MGSFMCMIKGILDMGLEMYVEHLVNVYLDNVGRLFG